MGRTRLGIVIAVLIVVPGCGVARSRVHGTLKYQGKPLGGAIISFFDRDNATFTARTRPDGTYAVDGIARGTIRVSVQVPPRRAKSRPEPSSVQKANKEAGLKSWQERKQVDDPTLTRIKLPDRYGNPETSDLSFELKEPDQDYSIDLK